MAISGDLLEMLACPQCKGELCYRAEKPALDCNSCGLSYPIRDDIPIMLVDEAEKLTAIPNEKGRD